MRVGRCRRVRLSTIVQTLETNQASVELYVISVSVCSQDDSHETYFILTLLADKLVC